MELTNSTPRLVPARPPWSDFLLYAVVGGGGVVGASIVASSLIDRTQTSLAVSILAYALDIVFFAGSVLVVGVARGKLSLAEIGFIPPRISPRWIVVSIFISLAILPLRGIIGLVVQFLASGSINGLQTRMDLIVPGGVSWASFLVTLIGAGILVPIAEELFFRGALYTWFRARFNFPVAVLISSTLFALGHLDTIGVVASSFVLAIANAWAFERSKTLWSPILMHITTNSIAVLTLYAFAAFGSSIPSP